MNSNQYTFLKCLPLSILTIVLRWGMCAALYRFTSIVDPRLVFSISWLTLDSLCRSLKTVDELAGWACKSLHCKTIQEHSLWQTERDFLKPWSCGSWSDSTVQKIPFSKTNHALFEDSDKMGFGCEKWGGQSAAGWQVWAENNKATNPCRSLSGHQGMH